MAIEFAFVGVEQLCALQVYIHLFVAWSLRDD